MKGGKVLVVFGGTLPRGQTFGYDTVIAPETLAAEIRAHGLAFEPLEDFVDPGSIEEAAAFLHELATVTFPDGTRVSESVTYQGYELWWAAYDQLYLQQCLPYTQYRRLLIRLQDCSSITLIAPPASALFRSYLEAHGCHYSLQDNAKRFPSIGIWLQVFISLLSWPILMVTRPRVMVYTGDLFDPPRDYSFRMRFIYEELRARKLPFVEFIRSMEPTRTMLAHAWKRRRPVIYSYAIKVVLSWIAGLLPNKRGPVLRSPDPEQAFRLALASMYVRNVRGTIWSIRAMNLLVRTTSVRTALIPAASSRTFHEVLGCREAGIPTVGILHGAASRFYNVYDFMPEYRGTKRLALDVYGMWSAWWRDYYIVNGKVYAPEQLVVSGPFRPLTAPLPPPSGRTPGPLRVLFIAEQLAEPKEILPYLEELMRTSDMELFFKFRPYNDGFEEWLKKYRADLVARMDQGHVMRGAMMEAISRVDVVVGSHSTAVLEALLQLKPMIFFYTKKWGDYFSLEHLNAEYGILAKTPAELIRFIRASEHAPKATLKRLQNMFFGDPYKNGSAWVVDELQKYLKSIYDETTCKKLLVSVGLRHPAKGIKISGKRKAEILLAYKTNDMTVFVETGTEFGTMIERLKEHFNEIHSIELDDTLYKDAVKRFQGERQIHLYHGDSATEIRKILPPLTSPALFWLDAHGGGDITFQNSPIEGELRAIFAHPVQGHIILIDDARHFNRSDIRKIAHIARANTYHCVIKEGLFILTPKG